MSVLPVVKRGSVDGHPYEVLEDRTPRRTLYRARLNRMPGCGMTGTTPEEAVDGLRRVLPEYLHRQRERGIFVESTPQEQEP